MSSCLKDNPSLETITDTNPSSIFIPTIQVRLHTNLVDHIRIKYIPKKTIYRYFQFLFTIHPAMYLYIHSFKNQLLILR